MNNEWPYSLVAVLLRQLLADQLVGPLLRLVTSIVGRDSGDDKRHFGG